MLCKFCQVKVYICKVIIPSHCVFSLNCLILFFLSPVYDYLL